jgi:hypothetical protein
VNDPTTDWTVLPNDIVVAALPGINAMEITGNPIVAVGSWDGQTIRVREQTYCYAAFTSDTPYTVSEVTREFATNG